MITVGHLEIDNSNIEPVTRRMWGIDLAKYTSFNFNCTFMKRTEHQLVVI